MRKVLAIVAHPDDETLGCGATLFRHHRDGDNTHCLVLSEGESSRDNQNIELRKRQFAKACEILGISDFKLLNFPDNALDTVGLLKIIQQIETYKNAVNPDIVYTHHSSDLNIDHQIVHQAVLTAFRSLPGNSTSQILSFQTPSSREYASHETRKSFALNHYVELDQECVEKKMAALACYEGELRDFPHPRSVETLTADLKLTGSQAGCRYAEGFFSERVIRRID